MITRTSIAPTIEAIDAWRARQPRDADGTIPAGGPSYGVNVWTRRGRCRCIVGKMVRAGATYYRTIRGEGSSNGGRETLVRAALVRAADIARAEGWIVGDEEAIAELVSAPTPGGASLALAGGGAS